MDDEEGFTKVNYGWRKTSLKTPQPSQTRPSLGLCATAISKVQEPIDMDIETPKATTNVPKT